MKKIMDTELKDMKNTMCEHKEEFESITINITELIGMKGTVYEIKNTQKDLRWQHREKWKLVSPPGTTNKKPGTTSK